MQDQRQRERAQGPLCPQERRYGTKGADRQPGALTRGDLILGENNDDEIVKMGRDIDILLMKRSQSLF